MLAELRDLLCRFCAQSADLAPMSLCGSGEGLRGIRVHMSENDGLPCSWRGLAGGTVARCGTRSRRAGEGPRRSVGTEPFRHLRSRRHRCGDGSTRHSRHGAACEADGPLCRPAHCRARRWHAFATAIRLPPDQSLHDAGIPHRGTNRPSDPVTRLLRSVPPPPYPP